MKYEDKHIEKLQDYFKKELEPKTGKMLSELSKDKISQFNRIEKKNLETLDKIIKLESNLENYVLLNAKAIPDQNRSANIHQELKKMEINVRNLDEKIVSEEIKNMKEPKEVLVNKGLVLDEERDIDEVKRHKEKVKEFKELMGCFKKGIKYLYEELDGCQRDFGLIKMGMNMNQ